MPRMARGATGSGLTPNGKLPLFSCRRVCWKNITIYKMLFNPFDLYVFRARNYRRPGGARENLPPHWSFSQGPLSTVLISLFARSSHVLQG